MRVVRVLNDEDCPLRARRRLRPSRSSPTSRSPRGSPRRTSRLRTARAARAGRAHEDRVRRHQLPQPHRGDGPRAARRAGHLPQAVRPRERPRRRRSSCPPASGASTTRASSPSSSAGARTSVARRRGALDHVLGYTCANDVTARDLQSVDGQWTRAKGFDGFCPLGPVGRDRRRPERPAHRDATSTARSCSRRAPRDMIFDPYELVSFVSHVMTLLPGDVVLTGTPGGIGPMVPRRHRRGAHRGRRMLPSTTWSRADCGFLT